MSSRSSEGRGWVYGFGLDFEGLAGVLRSRFCRPAMRSWDLEERMRAAFRVYMYIILLDLVSRFSFVRDGNGVRGPNR
jgi:hypothetical protein